MKKILTFLSIFTIALSFAQVTEQAVLKEAKSRNINSRADALKALKANGISENEARQMARQQGLDYDSFLNSYFPNQTNTPTSSSVDPDTSLLVQETTVTTIEQPTAIADENISIPKSDSRYFGYDIFDANPFLEKEYLLGNIDEEYLISPGDKLRIIVFGINSLELEATVDRNGNINIPNYGIFFAAGNTFKTLKSRLQTFLGKYFSGLLTRPQQTFLDVSLTQLSPTKVVVMGQVNAPGPHILTTQANPLAALYSSGGVATAGSLRAIKVYRNNKLIHTIDLYDYITTGKLSKDIKLTNNDVVFVPPRLSSVSLTGAVKTTGIYELNENEGLEELIVFSGGLPPTAVTNKVNISTITSSENSEFSRILKTINYDKVLASKKPVALKDGDQVNFFSILDVVENKVTISGNVYQPGEYALDQYPTLKDLILNAARGIKEDTYMAKVDISGVILPQGKEIFATYDLYEVISGTQKVALNDRDQVRIYNKTEVEGAQNITISGFGIDGTKQFPFFENQSLYDLIFVNAQLEKPEFEAEVLSRIDLKRFNVSTGMYGLQRFRIDNIQTLKSVFLEPSDQVVLYSNSTLERRNKVVTVGGFVKSPGIISLQDEMYIEDALLTAGGFDDLADKRLVYVNREEIDPLTPEISKLYTIELDPDYLIGQKDKPDHGFVLQDKDVISVRKELGKEPLQVISVVGEVNYPRSVINIYENMSFQELIQAAGGLKEEANLKASVVKRNGEILSIDLSTMKQNDLIFEDGDVVEIAKNIGEVKVSGAVENESLFVWEEGKRAKYYIRNSGGRIAKEASNSYVIFPNGKSKAIGFFKNPKILPDSRILVNRKAKKERKNDGTGLQNAVNVVTVLVSLLTSAILATKL
jgi:protein involved in polysaccharide export with SLBB domain